MMEIWKDIPGYEGIYQISNLGNVRSLEREVVRKNGKHQTFKGKMIKPCKNQENCGHLHLTLHNQGKTETFYIHRLVAEHFVPNPKNLPVVNHKDFDPTNNKAENLEWCTQMENVRYSSNRMQKPKQAHKATNTGEKYIRKIGGRYYLYIRRNLHISKSFDALSDAVTFRDGVLG